VQELGRNVCTIGPDQRVKLWVNLELLKHEWIAQWFEDGPFERWLQIDLATRTVTEAEPHHVAGNVTRLDDVIIHDRYSSGAIRLSGCPCLASCQFSSNSDLWRFVHSSTSFNARAGKSVNRGCLDLDGDFVFSVHRVKMRYAVLAVEHADHDAEKSRQFRHFRLTVSLIDCLVGITTLGVDGFNLLAAIHWSYSEVR
jgi:hypothetical protein